MHASESSLKTHTSRSGHSPPTAFSPGACPTPSLRNVSSCVFTARAFCFKLLSNNTQKVNIVTYLKTIRMTRKTQKHLPLSLYSPPSHSLLTPVPATLGFSHFSPASPILPPPGRDSNMNPSRGLHKLHVGSHVFLHNLHSHLSPHTLAT